MVAGLTANPGIDLFVKIISRITALYGASGRRSVAKQRQERPGHDGRPSPHRRRHLLA